MSKSMSHVNQAIATAYATVRLCEARIMALRFAVEGLRECWRYDEQGKKDYSAIYAALYKNLNDAYRTLFMWSLLKPEAQLEGAKAAFDRYLKSKSGCKTEIMSYLSPDLAPPGKWDGGVEDSFRSEIERLAKDVDEKLLRRKRRPQKGSAKPGVSPNLKKAGG